MISLEEIHDDSNNIMTDAFETNYKILLFQHAYMHAKYGYQISTRISTIVQFISEIDNSVHYKDIFIKVIEAYMNHDGGNAVFYADKLVTLTNSQPLAVYLLGECYYLQEDYVRVSNLFEKQSLLYDNENYMVLAAKGLEKAGQFENTIKLLTLNLNNSVNNSTLMAEKYHILARCNKNIENRIETESKLFDVLKIQPTNVKAYMELVDCKNFTFWQITEILNDFNLSEAEQWIKDYYIYYFNNKFRKNVDEFINKDFPKINNEIDTIEGDNRISNASKQKEFGSILETLIEKNNIDLIYLKAKNYFDNYKINSVFEICLSILEKNYFHFDTLMLYTEILVDKNLVSELFSCSCNLAENYPNHYVTYHVFGMYYFLLKKYESARKYFNKAIHQNKNSLKSWIMLGHSFANQEESEQAMNVYRSCIRQFPNSHLPHLYMGMEYLRINNLKTGLLSMKQAKDLVGPDPIVYNEIGCVYLKEKQYDQAKHMFLDSLKHCEADGVTWLRQIVYNNLGNAHRKCQEYKQAVQCYEESLKHNPNEPSVLFSLAFCYHLTGQFKKAINLYHRVVTMKYDTHFVNHMLVNCLSDFANNEHL